MAALPMIPNEVIGNVLDFLSPALAARPCRWCGIDLADLALPADQSHHCESRSRAVANPSQTRTDALCAFSLVSRAWYVESTRRLYSKATLASARAFVLLARTLLERPHLGRHLRESVFALRLDEDEVRREVLRTWADEVQGKLDVAALSEDARAALTHAGLDWTAPKPHYLCQRNAPAWSRQRGISRITVVIMKLAPNASTINVRLPKAAQGADASDASDSLTPFHGFYFTTLGSAYPQYTFPQVTTVRLSHPAPSTEKPTPLRVGPLPTTPTTNSSVQLDAFPNVSSLDMVLQQNKMHLTGQPRLDDYHQASSSVKILRFAQLTSLTVRAGYLDSPMQVLSHCEDLRELTILDDYEERPLHLFLPVLVSKLAAMETLEVLRLPERWREAIREVASDKLLADHWTAGLAPYYGEAVSWFRTVNTKWLSA